MKDGVGLGQQRLCVGMRNESDMSFVEMRPEEEIFIAEAQVAEWEADAAGD